MLPSGFGSGEPAGAERVQQRAGGIDDGAEVRRFQRATRVQQQGRPRTQPHPPQGRDPAGTTLREIAEPPAHTIDADRDLDDAFRFLEDHDLERVPVVEDGKLVGILSRAVVQRRLAEDEPPPDEPEGF